MGVSYGEYVIRKVLSWVGMCKYLDNVRRRQRGRKKITEKKEKKKKKRERIKHRLVNQQITGSLLEENETIR